MWGGLLVFDEAKKLQVDAQRAQKSSVLLSCWKQNGENGTFLFREKSVCYFEVVMSGSILKQ